MATRHKQEVLAEAGGGASWVTKWDFDGTTVPNHNFRAGGDGTWVDPWGIAWDPTGSNFFGVATSSVFALQAGSGLAITVGGTGLHGIQRLIADLIPDYAVTDGIIWAMQTSGMAPSGNYDGNWLWVGPAYSTAYYVGSLVGVLYGGAIVHRHRTQGYEANAGSPDLKAHALHHAGYAAVSYGGAALPGGSDPLSGLTLFRLGSALVSPAGTPPWTAATARVGINWQDAGAGTYSQVLTRAGLWRWE